MKTRSFPIVALAMTVGAGVPALAQKVEPWVSGLTKPVDFAPDPASESRFYVVEQNGTIRIIDGDAVVEEPFFSIDTSDFTTQNWEQGLLGLAFDPGYEDNGLLYVNYTARDGATRVSRFHAPDWRHVDMDSEEILLEIEQPFGNHNGGCIRFGPDGMLYIGMGDGGAANDPHNAGQRLDTLLGKILRIDVTGEPDPGKKYAIPDDNPFVGDEHARDEIWAYGLRNPWRLEFDNEGNLWIADVGQNRFEEVHVQRAGSKGGENYGWKVMEGAGKSRPGRAEFQDPPKLDAKVHRDRGMEPPVFTYRHHPLGSITGGYVYEGKTVPRLDGRYICADFMSGRVWSFKLSPSWRADDVVEHTDAFNAGFGEGGSAMAISSFGRDHDGELYVLDMKGGRVLKIVE